MRRLTARFALGVFVLALVLPSVVESHAWTDADLSGGEASLFVGHATTQVESPRAPVGPEHCALCHWLRSLGSSVVGGPAAGPAAARHEHPLEGPPASRSVLPGSHGPARAPPASSAA